MTAGGAPQAGGTARAVATCLGVGYAPLASGTAGTLAAVGIYLAGWGVGGHYGVLLLALLVTAAGVPAASILEKQVGYHDPSEVVVDEVAGFLVTMIFVEPAVWTVIAGFLMFRALDVLKPWPASALERLPGGWGIVADDLACGVMANAALQTGLWLLK